MSLLLRLFIAASIVLAAFLGLTGYLLDQSFQESTQAATRDRLQGHLYTLIAFAEITPSGTTVMPKLQREERFNQINSGLYAQILRDDGEDLWLSISSKYKNLPKIFGLTRAQHYFDRSYVDDEEVFVFAFGVSWDPGNPNQVYTFNVIENLSSYNEEIKKFRKQLWFGLSSVAFFLLIVQTLTLHWGLSPLRKSASQIKRIEQGQQELIQGHYPSELRSLTDNLNQLLSSSKEQLERYRHSLGDLAHSLKTPLTLLQNSMETETDCHEFRLLTAEQIERMRQITDYQLQRAATSGTKPLTKPVQIHPIAEKISHSLAKIYQEKKIVFILQIPQTSEFYGDQGDLYEVLGNLLDNAAKWCQQKVSITVETHKDSHKANHICIEDDGPGIDKSLQEEIIKRGVKSTGPAGGSGIGLAIVQDIIKAYQGQFHVRPSKLGGAAFIIQFP